MADDQLQVELVAADWTCVVWVEATWVIAWDHRG